MPTILRSLPSLLHRGGIPLKSSDGSVASIFDWDDTLICTSFLEEVGGGTPCGVPPGVKSHMKRMETEVVAALSEALRLGRVFIVTNATRRWVEESTEQYLPGVKPLLQRVSIISARASFEAHFPDEAGRWKQLAFLDLVGGAAFRGVTDLVVVGDGPAEVRAAETVRGVHKDLRVKVVKFVHAPSPFDIVRQLQLLTKTLETTVKGEASVDICLEGMLSGRPALPSGH